MTESEAPKPGDWVRTKTSLLGIKQGPSRKHGDGDPGEVPRGALCEIYDLEPLTGLLTLHFELEDSGAHEPYRVQAHAFMSEVRPARRRPLPPILPPGTPEEPPA